MNDPEFTVFFVKGILITFCAMYALACLKFYMQDKKRKRQTLIAWKKETDASGV